MKTIGETKSECHVLTKIVDLQILRVVGPPKNVHF